MARLKVLPGLDVIRGYKGVLDFYVRRGVPCVRRWPYTPKSRRTPGSIAAAALFGEIIKGYNLLGDGPLQAFRDEAADQPRTARDLYVSAVFGHLHERTIIPPPPPPEEQMYDAYVSLRDLKPSGTSGGGSTADTWIRRDLNQEQADTLDICTLEANQFTLPAGTYRAMISCPAYRINEHQTRLYDATADATLLLGTSEYADYDRLGHTRSVTAGRFTLPATHTLQVEHNCDRTTGTYGLGKAAMRGDEIYTIAEFWREIEPE